MEFWKLARKREEGRRKRKKTNCAHTTVARMPYKKCLDILLCFLNKAIVGLSYIFCCGNAKIPAFSPYAVKYTLSGGEGGSRVKLKRKRR